MGGVVVTIVALLVLLAGCVGSGQQEDPGFALASIEPEHYRYAEAERCANCQSRSQRTSVVQRDIWHRDRMSRQRISRLDAGEHPQYQGTSPGMVMQGSVSARYF